MAAGTRIAFVLNGRRVAVEAPPMKRLLDVLREECGLTGTKEGCGEGECGACTVLMNGVSVNSCLVPAVQAHGTKLLTIEGLAQGKTLSALQTAFIEMGGAQCGICTPGMLVSAHELLARHPGRVPGDAEVREALAGNLCRCTGYQKIVDAVRAAAKAGLSGQKTPRERKAGKKAARVKKAAAARRGSVKKKVAGPRRASVTRRGAKKKTAAKAARRHR